MCVGCRRREPWSRLLRLVLATGGGTRQVQPDAKRRLPGRGAWIHPALACLESAERRRAIGRALRTTAVLDTTLVRAFLSATGYPPVPPAGDAGDNEDRKRV